MASFSHLAGLMKPSRGQMLDLPEFTSRLNFYARIQKRRREIKAYRRWIRTQRLQARLRATYAPSWHPDAHPWDQETR